jgi:hypothetical protein
MTLKLRALPWSVRSAVALLMLVTAGGMAASWMHIFMHHSNRDEQPGLSYEDIAGAYHGVKVTAPLLRAVERGHPEGLPAAEREALAKWLKGTRVSEDYDNADLGEMAPVEIIARSCLTCHARSEESKHPIAKKYPLDYFDDVRKFAVSREIKPMEKRVLVMSTHTHALAMAPLTAMVAGLVLCTAWPGFLRRSAALLGCVGLAADVAGWWLARESEPLVWVVIIGGGIYSAAMTAMILMVLVDVLRPGRATPPATP